MSCVPRWRIHTLKAIRSSSKTICQFRSWWTRQARSAPHPFEKYPRSAAVSAKQPQARLFNHKNLAIIAYHNWGQTGYRAIKAIRPLKFVRLLIFGVKNYLNCVLKTLIVFPNRKGGPKQFPESSVIAYSFI